MLHTGQEEFGQATRGFRQQRKEQRSLGDADMALALLHRGYDLLGNLLARYVDEQLKAVEALEAVLGRCVAADVAQHLGGYGSEFDDGGSNPEAFHVGAESGREVGEPRLGRRVRGQSWEHADTCE